MDAKVLILDNNDSFTWNLVQLFREAGVAALTVEATYRMPAAGLQAFTHIVLSPGPGLPEDFPLLGRLAEAVFDGPQILGVCLGHQAIARAFGARLYNLPQVRHGLVARILPDPACPLFAGLEGGFDAGLYHSWAVADQPWPAALEVTARDETGVIMALRHRYKPIQGVQFHPESFMTPAGSQMVRNWLGEIIS